MALVQATLASQLTTALNELTGDNPPASPPLRLAQAFGEYFKGASAGGPVNPASVDAAVTAMAGAMSFPAGSAGAGAASFAGGFSQFWTVLEAGAATAFPGHLPGTPPAGLGSLASALEAQFGANNADGITAAQAATNLASAIHANAGLGGTVLIPGAPPTPVPIT